MKTDFIELVQKEFSHISSLYFNTAYLGPSPIRAKARAMEAVGKELDPSSYPHAEWRPIPDLVRSQISRLLGVGDDHISHHSAVSEVISHIANGFNFKSGDEVVTFDGEYPSNVLPWMLLGKQRGYKLRLLEASIYRDVNRFKEALSKNTRIVDLSHVKFNTGERAQLLEIGRILQERGILFVVDGSQAFGGLALKPEELAVIDVYTAASYKWCLGPYGQAWAYFSPRALESIERSQASWLVSTNSQDSANLLKYTLETLPGARKFDRGQSPNFLAMSMLHASLSLFEEVGLRNVEEHNGHLAKRFLGLYPKNKFDLVTPSESMANIVCLRAKGAVDPHQLENELKSRKIDISIREGNLRFSFHLFNTEKQLETLIEALESV